MRNTTPSRAVKAEAHPDRCQWRHSFRPEKAKYVLDHSGADAVMIGRAAQGRPWLFREIEHYLKTGAHLPPARVSEIHDILRAHLDDLYSFYGIETGVRVARKHIAWYLKGLVGSAAFRHAMNQLPTLELQQQAANDFLSRSPNKAST